jgi:xylulokinase
MAPEWNAAARGAWAGLTPAHGTGHLARAVLEASAHAMRDVVDRLAELGCGAMSLLLLGGGARSDVWAQIRADVTGLPVRRAARLDTCPVGAAMLAAVAAGTVPDLAAAAARIPPAEPAAEPRPEHRAAADEAHARYRRLYDSLRPTFR